MGRMRDRVLDKARKSMGQGSNYFSFPSGTNVNYFKAEIKTYFLDILPYRVSVDSNPDAEKGELFYNRTIWVHYKVGPAEKAVLCPKRMEVGRCPICEELDSMAMEDDKDTEKMVQSMKAKRREIFNIIDTRDKDKGVQFWEMSYFNFGNSLQEEINNGPEEYGDFPELKDGKTIEVRFGKGTFGNSKPFPKASRIDFRDREDYPDSILDDTIDLDKVLVIESYEKLSKIFYGSTPEDESKSNDKEAASVDSKKEAMLREKTSRKSEDTKKKESDKKESNTAESDNKCPYGHTYGSDCDSTDDCESCNEWDDCFNKKRELRKSNRNTR